MPDKNKISAPIGEKWPAPIAGQCRIKLILHLRARRGNEHGTPRSRRCPIFICKKNFHYIAEIPILVSFQLVLVKKGMEKARFNFYSLPISSSRFFIKSPGRISYEKNTANNCFYFKRQPLISKAPIFNLLGALYSSIKFIDSFLHTDPNINGQA